MFYNMFVSIWHDLNINMYDYLFCTLAYPSYFYVVCLSFAMITCWVGVDVVVVSETPLEDEESYFRLVEGLNGKPL